MAASNRDAAPVQGRVELRQQLRLLPGPEGCSWPFSPSPGKPIGALGARHSCRFSVNHSLVSAGGQTFWTVKRRKRHAPVSRSYQFNCIVPVQDLRVATALGRLRCPKRKVLAPSTRKILSKSLA
jgi:hypothetical protein